MNFDQFVSEYIAEDHDIEQLSVMVLEGCRAWYPLAAEAEKQKLQEVMEKAARAAADAHRFGRYGFFLYDQTGEEQYRTWIERNAEWLKNSPQSENGVFGCVEDSSRNISGSVMFAVYPFYMEYETRYNNKKNYPDIFQQFRFVIENMRNPLLTLAPSEQTDMEQTGWYLMTVIDVIDSMSREIFEHYKSLEEIFKKTIRNILAAGWNNDFSKKESAMMGYSIIKACNLGVLNSEKYAEIGLSMIDGLIKEPFDSKDSERMGIAMMAYAQRLILSRE